MESLTNRSTSCRMAKKPEKIPARDELLFGHGLLHGSLRPSRHRQYQAPRLGLKSTVLGRVSPVGLPDSLCGDRLDRVRIGISDEGLIS